MPGEIIGLLGGAHPAHQKIFSSFSNELYFMLGPWSPGRKHSLYKKAYRYVYYGLFLFSRKPSVVLVEGAIPSAVIGIITRFFSKNIRILSLVAEDAYYKCLKSPRSLRAMLLRKGLRIAAAVIAIGPMVEQQIKQMGFQGPVYVMYPDFDRDQFANSSFSSYRAQSKIITQIGGGDIRCKGIDITLKIASLCDQMGLIFKILGYEKEKITADVPNNVKLPGWVADVLSFLQESALVIHPGRGDAFPVATLEAMAAGIPVMLSEETGTSEIIKDDMPNFVRKCNAENFYEGVMWFFSLSEDDRTFYSRQVKELYARFLLRSIIRNEETRLAVRELIAFYLAKT